MENIMVLGYAPEYPAPVVQRTATCPRCKAVWEEVGEAVTEHPGCDWEHTDPRTQVATAWHEYPASPRGCPCCAISSATAEQVAAYIERHDLCREALEYCIVAAWDWPHALRGDYVPEIWQALRARLMEEDVLRDYIRDEKSDEFVRWYMEG